MSATRAQAGRRARGRTRGTRLRVCAARRIRWQRTRSNEPRPTRRNHCGGPTGQGMGPAHRQGIGLADDFNARTSRRARRRGGAPFAPPQDARRDGLAHQGKWSNRSCAPREGPRAGNRHHILAQWPTVLGHYGREAQAVTVSRRVPGGAAAHRHPMQPSVVSEQAALYTPWTGHVPLSRGQNHCACPHWFSRRHLSARHGFCGVERMTLSGGTGNPHS